MGKVRNIFIIMLLVLVSACANQSEGRVCFRADGTVTNVDGNQMTDEGTQTLQGVSDYIKEKKVLSTIINKIRTELFGGGGGGKAAQMFSAIANDFGFQSAITSAFILFVTFYGLGVAGGYLQASTSEAVIRVAKMGFIATMALNWGEFYGFIGSFFMDGRDNLMAYLMNGFVGSMMQNVGSFTGVNSITTESIFGGLDDMVAKIFSPHMLAIVAALFDLLGQNSGPYAIGYGLLLFTGLMALFKGIMNVATVYIFSLFANVILFAIAPIYLTFLLFEKTKPMFDSWVKQLVNYNLQPILAVLFLSLFMQLMGPFLDEILGQAVVSDNGGSSQGKTSNWRFASPDCSQVYNFGGQSPPPLNLQTILLFVFFSWCFRAYIEITGGICVALTNSMGNLSQIGDQMFSKISRGMGGGGMFGGGGRK